MSSSPFAPAAAGTGAGRCQASGAAGCRGRCAGLASSGRVSAFDTVIGRVDTPGVLARRHHAQHLPTSITLAFSRLFHLTRSFQFWPLSSPTRIIVSPGLTV